MDIDGLPITTPGSVPPRFSGIIWGMVGAGKTPLAATAPPPILFIQFDNNGDQSIRHVGNRYQIMDLSGVGDDVVDRFERLDTPFMAQLERHVRQEAVRTVVLDSVTSLMDRALSRGIVRAARMVTRGDRPTPIAPQMLGYGARSNITRYAIMNLHTLCSRLGVNFIAVAHQKTETDKEGNIEAITMMLGGETYVQVPKNFSEVWMLMEKDGKHHIYVRNFNKFEPCRTRMFRTDRAGAHRFEWKFNPYEWEGDGIEQWMAKWEKNGQAPIPLPT